MALALEFRTAFLIGAVSSLAVIAGVEAQPTFKQQFSFVSSESDTLEIADLNGDRLPDLITGSSLLRIALSPIGNGSTFNTVAVPVVSFSGALGKGDIDNDGDIDIVAGDGAAGENIAWYENPNNINGTWIKHLVGPAGEAISDIVVADFDRDNKLDILVHRDKTTVFFQVTSTIFQANDISSLVTPGAGIASGDIDNDGDTDIAGNGSWFENPLSRSIVAWPRRSITPRSVGATLVADFNGDGAIEVLFYNPAQGGAIGIYRSIAPLASGSWSETIIETTSSPSSVGIGDFDGDGKPDITVSSGSSTGVLSFFYNSGGTFNFRKDSTSKPAYKRIRVADFDNDRKSDLVGFIPGGQPRTEIILDLESATPTPGPSPTASATPSGSTTPNATPSATPSTTPPIATATPAPAPGGQPGIDAPLPTRPTPLPVFFGVDKSQFTSVCRDMKQFIKQNYKIGAFKSASLNTLKTAVNRQGDKISRQLLAGLGSRLFGKISRSFVGAKSALSRSVTTRSRSKTLKSIDVHKKIVRDKAYNPLCR